MHSFHMKSGSVLFSAWGSE